ncbi:MAG: helix-hairpin-helix domain-containing protein [Bacteroidetes bacterium]|nr:helix-hairpin-helix domain-containing protein [Bacteroidota bacterium]MBS1540792.1 helix-hairpin-helix domain-containing protein [Bacteroidota bacterium]
MTTTQTIKALTTIPGVGKSIATDLYNIGIRQVSDLKGKDPQMLYDCSNQFAGCVQDRCLLYVFRCAVYFAETPTTARNSEKLKWWNWKDKKTQ